MTVRAGVVLALVLAITGACRGPQDGARAFADGDWARAFAETRPLAEQGDAAAQFRLGLLWQDGRGVPADPGEAAHWYERAAEQGLAAAQANLGLLYLQGEGVAKDDVEAARWFRAAAEQGFAFAEERLGRMHEHGRGAPEDAAEAWFWYARAERHGAPGARASRERVAGALSTEALQDAERRLARDPGPEAR